MGRILRIGAVLVAVVALAAGCQNQKIRDLQAANTKLQEDLAEANNAQARLIEQKGNLEGQLSATRGQIGKLDSSNSALKDKVALLLKELSEQPPTPGLPAKLKNALIRFADENGEIVTLVGERVRFKSDILFRSGSADVSPKGADTLAKFAEIFNAEGAGLYLRIDGHTDTDPIRRAAKSFKDNWALGYGRSRNVAEIIFGAGVSKDRIILASHAMFTPLAEGNSKEAKAKNRRVEILIIPAK